MAVKLFESALKFIRMQQPFYSNETFISFEWIGTFIRMNWELYLDKISNRYIGGYADTGKIFLPGWTSTDELSEINMNF